MPVKLITPDASDSPGGVSQYYSRMVRACAALGCHIEWLSPQQFNARGGNPYRDLLILTNQDVRLIPQPYAVIGVAHGSAMERGIRNGNDPMWVNMGKDQAEAGRRPRTFWVSTCPISALDCKRHMGVTVDRCIVVGCDTTMLYPSERQTRRDARVPVIVHNCSEPNKGNDVFPAVEAELRGEFTFRRLACAPDKLGDFLRAADMFLQLSREEGGPNVICEAMTAGLVVVGSDVGILAALTRDVALPSRDPAAVGWINRDAGVATFDWRLLAKPHCVVDFIRGAWAARAILDPRPFALQHFSLPVYGQKWCDAIQAAAAKLGVTL